jgi:hypothetical protein
VAQLGQQEHDKKLHDDIKKVAMTQLDVHPTLTVQQMPEH